MGFSIEQYSEMMEREEAERTVNMIPVGKYNWEIIDYDVSEVATAPRLTIKHQVIAAEPKHGGSLNGRMHTEFINWYASETSTSDKPYEQRERGLRAMTGRKLDNYVNALATSPTSTQEQGDEIYQLVQALHASDDTESVAETLGSLGIVLQRHIFTGSISHSGTWANLKPIAFEEDIGALVTV